MLGHSLSQIYKFTGVTAGEDSPGYIFSCKFNVGTIKASWPFSVSRYNFVNIGLLSMLVGISEAICVVFIIFSLLSLYNHGYNSDITLLMSIIPITKSDSDRIFKEWLAGLIDGDGCFLLSKKGYASLEITVETRDKEA